MKSLPVALAVFVFSSGSPGAGQLRHDEHVRLVLSVNAIDLPYEEATPRQHRAVFFVGEAITATVTLVNSTAGIVEIAEPWTKQLVLRLRSSTNRGSDVVLPLSAEAISRTTTVPAARKLEVTRHIVSSSGDPLPPGHYLLEAALPARVLENRPRTANDALIASGAFEVRTVKTQTDELNALHHAAVRARWAGNTRQAKTLIAELLTRAPNSPGAYAEMGAALAAEHDCAGAKQAYERAILLARSGAASEDRILKNAHVLAEWIEVGLPEAIRACR